MLRRRFSLSLALFFTAALTARAAEPSQAFTAQGHYVEARTCDVWTGPCFANADFNLGGKNAVLAWRIDQGRDGETSLNGLSVVAIVAAHNTLGLEQRAPAKAVLLVDRRATTDQRDALVRLARRQGGELLANVVGVQPAPITLTTCACKGNACTELDAGVARIKTRCIDSDHDKACGNETAFYPPLAQGVRAIPAAAEEHQFRGTGLGQTWTDNERRGAYVGSFEVR